MLDNKIERYFVNSSYPIMRILRPFARYTALSIVEPWECSMFLENISPRMTNILTKFEPIDHSRAIKFAAKRTRIDVFMYLFARLFPLAVHKQPFMNFRESQIWNLIIAKSNIIRKCFRIAVEDDNFTVAKLLYPISGDISWFLDAATYGSCRVGTLIYKTEFHLLNEISITNVNTRATKGLHLKFVKLLNRLEILDAQKIFDTLIVTSSEHKRKKLAIVKYLLATCPDKIDFGRVNPNYANYSFLRACLKIIPLEKISECFGWLAHSADIVHLRQVLNRFKKYEDQATAVSKVIGHASRMHKPSVIKFLIDEFDADRRIRI